MSKIQNLLKTSIVTLTGMTLLACGASLGEYQTFARAGQEYVSAIDDLLVISGDYFVDANSENLIANDLQDPDVDSSN